MSPLFRLQVLVLATTLGWASGCSSKDEAPQPLPFPPVASLNTHAVTLRYHSRPLDGVAPLPTGLNLLVAYERVSSTGPTKYVRLAPTVQFHDPAISAADQDVPLSLIATYPGAISPTITVSLWQEQPQPTAAGAAYEVVCDLLVDGQVRSRTTYAVASGQIPPLVASTQTEVAP